MPGNSKRIAVVGIGNYLLSDEGVGIHAVKKLMKETLPPYVEIIDGGTAGIDLLLWMEEAKYVVIIDCIEAEAEPGTIFRLNAEEIPLSQNRSIFSLHDLKLPAVLSLAKRLGNMPTVVIYGVQPAIINPGIQLSPRVQDSLPRLLQMVKKEIEVHLNNEEK